MRRTKLPLPIVAATLVGMVAAFLVVVAEPAMATVFSNTNPIPIADPSTSGPPASCLPPPGRANPYPSVISVSGLTGTVSKVTVTLKNVSSTFAPDVDVLLVSPTGVGLVLVSDAGGTNPGTLTNVTVAFDDAAASQLPSSPPSASWAAPNSSVTSRPVDYDVGADLDVFPAPAPGSFNSPPPGGVATLASTFNGTTPNGSWSLYAVDDGCSVGDTNSIAGGWSLDITTAAAAAPTTTSVSSTPNPSTTGQSVSFAATVTSAGNPVTTGTVTFTEGATTLAANVAVNASGQASFSTSGLAEGNHTILASYNGTATLATSNSSVNQRVDNVTTNPSAGVYCNTGPIAIPSNLSTTPAVPYPSHITIAGFAGNVAKVTAQLKNVTHGFTDDIDVLLVGPSAANNLVLVSDAPRDVTAPATNVTATFDDAAAGQLPTGSGWGAPNSSVTAKPTDYDPLGAADVFPSPAPAPSSNTTLASAFNGTNPNGQWSLYVVDDGLGDAGNIAGGWCLTITSTAAVSISPTSVSFGSQTVGTQSNPASNVTITNTGGSPLNVAGSVVTGAEGSDFTISSNTCTAPLAPTASCVVGLRFTPGAPGDRRGALVVTDNTPTSPHTIPLSGNGVTAGTFNVADATPVSENNTTVSFAVSLSSTPAAATSVSYATQYGNATAGADYTYKEGTLTFAAGATGAALTQTVTVTILEDSAPETDESFFLQLYSPTAPQTLGDRFGEAIILNDDAAPPTVSVSAATPGSVSENNTTVSFNVTLSATPTTAVLVHYATNYGTATPGADYIYNEGILTWSTGATGAALTQAVTVSILEDTAAESDETFFLQLYDPSGAGLGATFGAAVIANDDGVAPIVSIANAPGVAEGNTTAQDRKASFAVTLSATPTTPVTVRFATMGAYFDSTATSEVDYVANEGVVTFAAGTATLTQQITVDIVEDTLVEPNETFYVQIYDASGATLAAVRYGMATVTNDD